MVLQAERGLRVEKVEGLKKYFFQGAGILSNNPTWHFVTGLIAARTMPGRRYALRNNEFAMHNLGGETEKRLITNADELASILRETFGLTLPQTEGLKPALMKIVDAAKSTS